MKLDKILERIAAEVYGKNQLKIKYLSPDKKIVDINTALERIDNTIAKYPQLRRHLQLIKQYISSLDRATLKTFNIQKAGWDIDITDQKIILKNDQGQIIKTIRL